MDTTIRDMQEKDLPQVLALVKELAVYEKEPDAVIASINTYEQAFEQGVFEGMVMLYKDKIIGMMIYYMTFSTWKGKMLYLEDFIITEQHRNKGLGQQLFNSFLKKAREKEAILCKWQVLDWNTPAVQFYKKNAAILEKEWWNGKIFI